MQNKFSSFFAYFRTLPSQQKVTVVTSLVLVITLPTLLLVISQIQNFSSKADTSTILETESGTISGNAVVKYSPLASGGKYIEFVASTSSQRPTPTTYQPPTPRPTFHPTWPSISWHPYPTITPRATLVPITPTNTPPPTHDNGNNSSQNGKIQGNQH